MPEAFDDDLDSPVAVPQQWVDALEHKVRTLERDLPPAPRAELERELAAHLVGDDSERWRRQLPPWLQRVLWDAAAYHSSQAAHHDSRATSQGSALVRRERGNETQAGMSRSVLVVLVMMSVVPAGAMYWALSDASWQIAVAGTGLGLVIGTALVAAGSWARARPRKLGR